MKAEEFPKPTESEMDVLKILWTHGPSTVRFVNEELNRIKETGYTTTLKIMQIMHAKGILSRNENTRTHVYAPLIEQNQAQDMLLKKLLNSAFSGSAMKLVMQVLGNHDAIEAELSEIKNLIQKIEGGKK